MGLGRIFLEKLKEAEDWQIPANEFWRKQRGLLHEITDRELMDTLGMQGMSRIIHVMQKKYGVPAHFVSLDNDWEIRCGEAVIGRASYQSVIIHFINIEDHTLLVEGESSVPACFPQEDAGVWVWCDNTYAWIVVPGMVIDYPVLQYPKEMDYYLEHNLDDSKGRPGCIYTQRMNNKDWFNRNIVLYSHNM